MSLPLLVPLRFLGAAAAGFGLAVGWKLGSHLVEVAMGKEDLLWPSRDCRSGSEPETNDVLKRKFSKISDD
jgi:hypothetical protein